MERSRPLAYAAVVFGATLDAMPDEGAALAVELLLERGYACRPINFMVASGMLQNVRLGPPLANASLHAKAAEYHCVEQRTDRCASLRAQLLLKTHYGYQ